MRTAKERKRQEVRLHPGAVCRFSESHSSINALVETTKHLLIHVPASFISQHGQLREQQGRTIRISSFIPKPILIASTCTLIPN